MVPDTVHIHTLNKIARSQETDLVSYVKTFTICYGKASKISTTFHLQFFGAFTFNSVRYRHILYT